MAIYLKQFKTQADYEAAGNGLILPNVSLTFDGNVHYKPRSPHDYVEIGGKKWATMNIGANSVTDMGLYFQWADIQGYTASQCGSGEGQKKFAWADYKYVTNVVSWWVGDITKYNSTDGKTVLESFDDAARINWGGKWRIPTTEEYVALGNAVTTAWTANYQGSGVAGLVCTAKADSSKILFFPACGTCGDGSVGSVGSQGWYWSSSVDSNDVQYAYTLQSSQSGHVYWDTTYYRNYGLPVRAVVNE